MGREGRIRVRRYDQKQRLALPALSQGRDVWGHVTARLLAQLPVTPPLELVERGRILDNYYIPARSPNGHDEGPAYEHYGSLHSSQALDHASQILDFVRKAVAES